jgi:hypothetical protein
MTAQQKLNINIVSAAPLDNPTENIWTNSSSKV